ncbi:MAG: hypothetical protein ACRENG_16890 [bacterium]
MAAVIEQQATRDEEKIFADLSAFVKPPLANGRLTFEQANKLAAGASFELIHGKLIIKAADAQHADAHARVCGFLYEYFKANPVGHVLMEFTLLLWPNNPYEARTPDLAVI